MAALEHRQALTALNAVQFHSPVIYLVPRRSRDRAEKNSKMQEIHTLLPLENHFLHRNVEVSFISTPG